MTNIKINNILKISLLAISSWIIFSQNITVEAAPYMGEVYKLKQPDSSYVEVKVFGDEYYQRVESLDGYTLIRDPETGWISYADLRPDGNEYVSTGIKYTDNNKNNKLKSKLKKGLKINKSSVYKKAKEVKNLLSPNSSMSPEDNYVSKAPYNESNKYNNILGLTILVKFPDETSAIPREEINNMINQVGYTGYGNNGSVRDYFNEVSGGQLTYTNYVTQYYTAKYPKSYYNDPNAVYGQRASELVYEALEDLELKGFDFSSLTTENNTVLAMNVFYAGEPDVGWAQGLWPHQSSLWYTFSADGVAVRTYQITNIGTNLSIGTFIHENGHMIFKWPDLYDYDYDSTGVGNYCLMGYMGDRKNPVPPNPYFRSRAGWGSVTSLNGYKPGSEVYLAAGVVDSYKYEGPKTNEYFMLENVRKTGRWFSMPGEGLLIWHIDEYGNNNMNERLPNWHFMVSVEQADGKYELENYLNYGEPNDLYRYPLFTEFGSATTPDSRWWDGTESGLNISDISEIGEVMTFLVNKNIDDTGGPDETSSIYQAEDASLYNAVVENEHSGFENRGYVNYRNEYGSYIEWTVNATNPGMKKLTLRFANGTNENRPMEIRINGQVVNSSLGFGGTGGWNVWSTQSIEVYFNEGVNIIRATSVSTNGGPNTDYLEIGGSAWASTPQPTLTPTSTPILTPTSTPTVTPTVTSARTPGSNNYQAEESVIFNGYVESEHGGFEGNGYVNYKNEFGGYIEWTVYVDEPGNYKFIFGYANGTKSKRPIEIRVNGSVIHSAMEFAGTGAWTKWSTQSIDMNLNQGINTIRATAVSSDGGPNVDYMKVFK